MAMQTAAMHTAAMHTAAKHTATTHGSAAAVPTVGTAASRYGTARGRANPGRTRRRRPRGWPTPLLVATLLLVGQLAWPLQMVVAGSQAAQFVPLSVGELSSITGGCTSDCDGDSGGGGGGGGRTPDEVGSPYWEFSHRSLISRPDVPDDLIWHRQNSTYREIGPYTVSYQSHNQFNWSIGGSVPSGVVRADLGSSYSRSYTETVSFTIPPRTYLKYYVAYPYERWRYYYKEWQDYDDNSRDQVGSGTATTYKKWTRTNLVSGSVL